MLSPVHYNKLVCALGLSHLPNLSQFLDNLSDEQRTNLWKDVKQSVASCNTFDSQILSDNIHAVEALDPGLVDRKRLFGLFCNTSLVMAIPKLITWCPATKMASGMFAKLLDSNEGKIEAARRVRRNLFADQSFWDADGLDTPAADKCAAMWEHAYQYMDSKELFVKPDLWSQPPHQAYDCLGDFFPQLLPLVRQHHSDSEGRFWTMVLFWGGGKWRTSKYVEELCVQAACKLEQLPLEQWGALSVLPQDVQLLLEPTRQKLVLQHELKSTLEDNVRTTGSVRTPPRKI